MTSYSTIWQGYKHPDDVDWRHVDFSPVLGEDTIVSVDTASSDLEIVEQRFTPEGMVSVKLAGGDVSSPSPATVHIAAHTAEEGTDRTIACDARLYIRR